MSSKRPLNCMGMTIVLIIRLAVAYLAGNEQGIRAKIHENRKSRYEPTCLELSQLQIG